MAQIKKMLSCMIVLSESLFFGEEMSHRVLKQEETVGEFSYLIPFFNNDYTFNHIVIQLIWVFLKISIGKHIHIKNPVRV